MPESIFRESMKEIILERIKLEGIIPNIVDKQIEFLKKFRGEHATATAYFFEDKIWLFTELGEAISRFPSKFKWCRGDEVKDDFEGGVEELADCLSLMMSISLCSMGRDELVGLIINNIYPPGWASCSSKTLVGLLEGCLAGDYSDFFYMATRKLGVTYGEILDAYIEKDKRRQEGKKPVEEVER